MASFTSLQDYIYNPSSHHYNLLSRYGVKYTYCRQDIATDIIEVFAKSKYTDKTHLVCRYDINWVKNREVIGIYSDIISYLAISPYFGNFYEDKEEITTNSFKKRLLLIIPG